MPENLITNHEVVNELNQIKEKKSLVLDGISIEPLKNAGDIAVDSLVTIFNLSLQTAIFPDDWKLAKVSPVFGKKETKMIVGTTG